MINANNRYYQSPLVLTESFQHNLINVSYLTACYLYLSGHDDVALLNDVDNSVTKPRGV